MIKRKVLAAAGILVESFRAADAEPGVQVTFVGEVELRMAPELAIHTATRLFTAAYAAHLGVESPVTASPGDVEAFVQLCREALGGMPAEQLPGAKPDDPLPANQEDSEST